MIRIEAHDDAEIDRLAVLVDEGPFFIARVHVVGADKDASAGDGGAAICLGAELGDPFDVLLFIDVPFGRQALGAGVDHVASGGAAVHDPVLAGRLVFLHEDRRLLGAVPCHEKDGDAENA